MQFAGLAQDTDYAVFLREQTPGGGAGWCPLLGFTTLPHPPVPLELLFCCDGRARFTWGVVPGTAPGTVLRGKEIPPEYIFTVQSKLRPPPRDPRPGQEPVDPELGWEVARVQPSCTIDLVLEHPVSQYLFRLKVYPWATLVHP